MDLREYLRERWTSTLLSLGKGSGTKFLFDGEQNQKEKTEQLGMEGHQHAKSNTRLWWPNTNQAKDDKQNQLGQGGSQNQGDSLVLKGKQQEPNINQAKDDEQKQLGPRRLSKPRSLSGPSKGKTTRASCRRFQRRNPNGRRVWPFPNSIGRKKKPIPIEIKF